MGRRNEKTEMRRRRGGGARWGGKEGMERGGDGRCKGRVEKRGEDRRREGNRTGRGGED